MVSVELTDILIENLRGFYSAQLNIERPRTILVGPNNSGKTSLLRLLNWTINELDEDLLYQRRRISEVESQLLLPARDARHRARRLTLYLRVHDARSWTKFGCDSNGEVSLRINIRLTPTTVVYASLGSPHRNEPAETQSNALELLRRLRHNLYFLHIPSFRDARSDRFDSTLHDAMRSRIEQRALHSSAGRTPQEHQQVSKSLNSLREVVLSLTKPLWNDVSTRLPPGLARDAILDLACDQAALLQFLESRLRLRISTGSHDALAVPIDELGSGLQSLLDLAFQDTQYPTADAALIIAAEEPEAFLHPSAQRTVASRLLNQPESGKRIIVTTHSPIVVEEARFGEVVICREHRFYEPHGVSDSVRDAINSSLLSGYGSEMIFGSSVLLVEGEGDRQFFERIRRRLAVYDSTGTIDRCFVVPVGGKARFGPWLRLLTSYGDSNERPLRFIVAADADSATEVTESFKDAGLVMPQDLGVELGSMATAMTTGDLQAWRGSVDRANKISRESDISLHFLKLDLEEAMLNAASDNLLSMLARECLWEDGPTKEIAMQRLGAKGHGGNNGRKDVYLRGLIGQHIAADELTINAKQCLRRWITNASNGYRADQIMSAWKT